MSYTDGSFTNDRPGFTEQTNSNSSYAERSGFSSNNNSGGGWQGNNGSGGGWKGNSGNSGGWKGNSGGGWKGGGGFQRNTMSPEQLAALKLPKRGIILTGNYNAPENIVDAIREFGDLIQKSGYVIRASSMNGFDKMVMDNFRDAEFHIPWKGFGDCTNPKSSYDSDQCKEFAKRYLPEWSSLKESHQAFWGKNVRLVLGKNLDAHAYAAVVWSDDGVEGPSNRGQRSGHAGHVAALCHACGIPVININNPNAIQRLRDIIEGKRNHE